MSKSSSKSSARIGGLLEQLQRLYTGCQEAKTEQEKQDFEQFRYVTNKIQQLLTSQEKCRKDLVSKYPDGLSTLLDVLEMSGDAQVVLNILGCLMELISTGKKCSVLASKGVVDILLKLLVDFGKESCSCDEILVQCHAILAKTGPKDRKFCIKARLTGALLVTMSMIRNNTANFRILHPTLQVLKIYTTNSVNCNCLSKAGAIGSLFKIITSCGHKRVQGLKLVLDVVASLVKSKSSACKAVNHGAVPVMLQMFCDWQRTDHLNRQAGVRKAILSVLKSIVMTKSGRKAFIQSDGIKILYSSALETLECRELDGVNNLSSQILRKCFPKNKLPIPSLASPLSFPLLEGQEAFGVQAVGSDDNFYLDDSTEDTSSGMDSDDDESELVSTEERGSSGSSLEQSSKSLEEKSKTEERKTQKPRKDLDMYAKFFPELFEVQASTEEFIDEEPAFSNPIFIPTGLVEYPVSAATPFSSPIDSYCLASHLDSVTFKAGCPGDGADSSQNNTGSPVAVEGSPTSQPADDTSMQESYLQTCVTKTYGSSTSAQVTNQDRGMRNRAANGMKCVLPIFKVPAPEIYGHYPSMEPEPLASKKIGLQRKMIFKDIERLIYPQKVINRVVFDLDSLLREEHSQVPHTSDHPTVNKNNVKPAPNGGKGGSASSSVGSSLESLSGEDSPRPLRFESRFESGNLRKAIQVRDYEYDLILNPDVNCKNHHQWFYFEVGSMEADVPYRFNIINCEKINSQFNFGMQPVLYSQQEAEDGNPGWVRLGNNVCYYRNYFTRSAELTGNQQGKTYFTLSFTIFFPYEQDTCFLAYHYPYTFSMLQHHLSRLESNMDTSEIFYRRSTLCDTLSGNPCDLLTITAVPHERDAQAVEAFKNRPYIFLTCRVHPGESNASWVMKGVLEFLLSNFYTAKHLRETFVFKIVPMLNPDGVINGCHRCSLSGDDLNRRWLNPSILLHPTIYHTKGLLQYLKSQGRSPVVYCDFHGHSRKKNVFMYGCSTAATIAATSSSSSSCTDLIDSDIADTIRERLAELSGSESNSSMDPNDVIEDTGFRILPKVLHNIAPAFSLPSCSFIVEKAKEATARVVVWKEIGVVRSYTMESSYCGCDQGPYKGFHLGTRELEEMGRFFCGGLLKLGRSCLRRSHAHRVYSNESSDATDGSCRDQWIRSSELFVPPPLYPSGFHDGSGPDMLG